MVFPVLAAGIVFGLTFVYIAVENHINKRRVNQEAEEYRDRVNEAARCGVVLGGTSPRDFTTNTGIDKDFQRS